MTTPNSATVPLPVHPPRHPHKNMIETERLILRPFNETDFEDLKGVWGDLETMSFYANIYSDEQMKEIISEQIQTFKEHGYGLYVVIEKENGSFLGDCGITTQDIDGVEEYEIGYRIKKEYWGLGYAPEAAQAVKEYAFNSLKLERLCSYMESSHQQSRRVAEKIGMKLEKEYLNPNNRNSFTSVYSINANQ